MTGVACGGGGDDGGDDDEGGGGAGMPATSAGTGGSAGSTASGMTGGSGGMGGLGSLIMCPMDPGVSTCGSETCEAVDANLAMICVQNCCTSDMKCGRLNASPVGSKTCAPMVNEDPDCPAIMVPVVGMVPGCCMDDGMTCGVQDQTGIFGGGCRSRCSAAILSSGIMDISCDGETMKACPAPMGGGSGGAGGMGGAAGMAGGGDAGDGGSGGSGGSGGKGGSGGAGGSGGSGGSGG
jgi:hypothetical protein